MHTEFCLMLNSVDIPPFPPESELPNENYKIRTINSKLNRQSKQMKPINSTHVENFSKCLNCSVAQPKRQRSQRIRAVLLPYGQTELGLWVGVCVFQCSIAELHKYATIQRIWQVNLSKRDEKNIFPFFFFVVRSAFFARFFADCWTVPKMMSGIEMQAGEREILWMKKKSTRNGMFQLNMNSFNLTHAITQREMVKVSLVFGIVFFFLLLDEWWLQWSIFTFQFIQSFFVRV